VGFLAQLFVFLFELLIHEEVSAFCNVLDVKRASSAPAEIIAQT
jgi:hypothetical protein